MGNQQGCDATLLTQRTSVIQQQQLQPGHGLGRVSLRKRNFPNAKISVVGPIQITVVVQSDKTDASKCRIGSVSAVSSEPQLTGPSDHDWLAGLTIDPHNLSGLAIIKVVLTAEETKEMRSGVSAKVVKVPVVASIRLILPGISEK